VRVSDSTTVQINLKWLIQIIVIVGIAVAGYYNLKIEIRDAADSPVSRGEYEMKFLYQGDKIIDLENSVSELELELKKLKDER
jgi:hypothetical protein